jgi:hypothetical protein
VVGEYGLYSGVCNTLLVGGLTDCTGPRCLQNLPSAPLSVAPGLSCMLAATHFALSSFTADLKVLLASCASPCRVTHRALQCLPYTLNSKDVHDVEVQRCEGKPYEGLGLQTTLIFKCRRQRLGPICGLIWVLSALCQQATYVYALIRPRMHCSSMSSSPSSLGETYDVHEVGQNA